MLAVAIIIVALTFWMERYVGLQETDFTSYKLHFRTWILLSVLMAFGILLEAYPFINEYSDEEMRNLPDDWGGHQWLGRGIPFAYHRIEPAGSLELRPLAIIEPRRITFGWTILLFDFILLGLAIAEPVYWFEKRQRRLARFVVIEEE